MRLLMDIEHHWLMTWIKMNKFAFYSILNGENSIENWGRNNGSISTANKRSVQLLWTGEDFIQNFGETSMMSQPKSHIFCLNII